MQKGYLVKSALFVFVLVISSCSPYWKGGYTPQEKVTLRQAQADENALDYSAAMLKYQQVFNQHRDDAYVNYKMGECYFNMNQVQEALTHLELAENKGGAAADPRFNFIYGLALQKVGNYKKAVECFEKYVKVAKKADLKYTNVQLYLAQVQYALKAKETLVGAVVKNIGDSLNSQYSDAHPSITADGKMLIFSSARPEGKGGLQVKDGKYFEDIYCSKYNSATESWGKATLLEGSINTKEHDANVSISPDGKSIYIYKNNQVGKEKTAGGDIYVSTLGSTGRWSKPKELAEINSSFFESSACISADGNRIFFTSDSYDVLHKNEGLSDIYMVEKDTTGKWSSPKNIGNVVNTAGDEMGVFLHPDGKTLFFASNGHAESFGGYDIYKTVYDKGTWTKPVNLGYPINTHREEIFFVLSTDGSTAYYTSQRVDSRKDGDIYQIDLKHYNVLTGETQKLAILKGQVEDKATGKLLAASINVTDVLTGEKITLATKQQGDFFNTMVAGRKYKVEVIREGFNNFAQEITLPVGDSKNIKELNMTIALDRVVPLDVVSRDLFRTQHLNFQESDSVKFTAFSQSIFDMYLMQLKKAPGLKVKLTAHSSGASEDDATSKAEAEVLLSFVKAQLTAKGIAASSIEVVNMGNDEPLADASTLQGKALNKRVDVDLKEN
jgi:tetratricopeptide (TPR) repeat protein/outer membrane protein OmpA-like peptidoglycan-associated protein